MARHGHHHHDDDDAPDPLLAPPGLADTDLSAEELAGDDADLRRTTDEDIDEFLTDPDVGIDPRSFHGEGSDQDPGSFLNR